MHSTLFFIKNDKNEVKTMIKTKNRLKKRKEFAYIFRKGERINAGEISCLFTKSKFIYPRFGLSVSNKVGNAVVRNKIKRQLRAILAEFLPKITYKNIIIIAHPEITRLSFQQIYEKVEKIFKKGNIIVE